MREYVVMKKLFVNWVVLPPVILLLAVCFFSVCYLIVRGKRESHEINHWNVAYPWTNSVEEGYGDIEIREHINAEIQVVALTIFAEAKGESHEGRVAVASVVWNRAHGKPDMLSEICMINKQFSCWNGKAGKKLDALKESKLNKKDAAVFQDCWKLAKEMMDGKFVPPITATHYHARSVRPLWAKSMRRVTVIGRHIFYRV